MLGLRNALLERIHKTVRCLCLDCAHEALVVYPSHSVGRDTNSQVTLASLLEGKTGILDAWTTLIAGTCEKGYLAPTEGGRVKGKEKHQMPLAMDFSQVPLV